VNISFILVSQSTDVTYTQLIRITERGEPVLVLSNDQSFAYDAQLCSWVRIADNHFKNSEFYRTLASSASEKSILKQSMVRLDRPPQN